MCAFSGQGKSDFLDHTLIKSSTRRTYVLHTLGKHVIYNKYLLDRVAR